MIVTITGCGDDILDLRKAGYGTREYNVRNIDTMADEFDGRSEHVSIWSAALPVATARLTAGPRSVFETWSQGKAEIPTGSHVVDLSRVAVRPDLRRMGLSSFVILESLRCAAERRFEFIVGATTREGALFDLLTQMGFAKAGQVVELLESQGQLVDVQPMVVVPSPRLMSVWREMQDGYRARLAASGFPIFRDADHEK